MISGSPRYCLSSMWEDGKADLLLAAATLYIPTVESIDLHLSLICSLLLIGIHRDPRALHSFSYYLSSLVITMLHLNFILAALFAASGTLSSSSSTPDTHGCP